jgi:MOSC domain-containing protein YiiM
MPRHLTKPELLAGLPHILAAPKDGGELQGIVVRPDHGQRVEPDSVAISAAGGLDGDHWATGCWRTTEDGKPHPDVQICIMSARCIALIAVERSNWAAAGDNLFLDMDLTPENLPPGQRLSLGTAVLEITAEPHNGCRSFAERYGREACAFVNSREGKRYRLRGIYARVVQDGEIAVGDKAVKLAAPAQAPGQQGAA